MNKAPKPKTVDAYIAAAPAHVRGKLREMRAAIRNAAPQAEEKISYRMPYYAYKGRLAYFAAFKNHIGLYIPSPVIAEQTNKVKKYQTTLATVRIPLDQRIPLALVRTLIKARVKKNLERLKK